MTDPEKRARVQNLLTSGLTVAEIAAEEGVSCESARRWARELGVKAARQLTQSVRTKAESMRAPDAVEYLLVLLEGLAPALCDTGSHHEVDDCAPDLTPAQRRMLIYMVDRENLVCSKQNLLSVHSMGALDEPSVKIVDVQVCKMRPKLPASFGQIVTVWGHGYRFQRAGRAA